MYEPNSKMGIKPSHVSLLECKLTSFFLNGENVWKWKEKLRKKKTTSDET